VCSSDLQSLRAHLDACTSCAQEAAATRALVELGRELPDGAPSEERAETVRRSLLAAAGNAIPGAEAGRRRRWIPLAAAASIALALGLVLLARGPSVTPVQNLASGETRKASVRAQKDAEHVLLGAQPDEMVRLTDGTITVEVAKLSPGERFRVVTGDAEIEVRGTAFDVTAKDDALVGVRVWNGKVEVRPNGREVVLLMPGEQWKSREASAAGDVRIAAAGAASGSAPVRAPGPRPAPVEGAAEGRLEGAQSRAVGLHDDPGTAPRAPALGEQTGIAFPAEAAFNAGWDALRIGRPAEAAALFGQAADIGSGASILEDAVFWRAVALDRSGAQASAADAMREFLQRFPASVRRGEASVMLGWKLLQNGDPAGARALFESALGDPVPWVRASAANGVGASTRR
jgi:hypothetical protein